MNCHKCGKGYKPEDVEMYAKTKEVQFNVLSMDNPGMRKLLGMKTLMKCFNCGKVTCADCATENAGGPTGMACPGCGVPFQENSFVPPTPQALETSTPAPGAASRTAQKPEKSDIFSRLFKRKR